MTYSRPISGTSLLNLNTSTNGINKQSLNSNFADKLRSAARESAITAQRTANYAAPYVPGAAVLSASLGSVAQNLGGSDPLTARLAAAPLDVPGSGRTDIVGVMEDMQQNMVSSNMQMLGLQRKFQQESEAYLMMSNMIKNKHDTSKNSINNIR